MDLRIKAFFIGLFGDMILQTIVKFKGNFAGLKGYFKQHGILESIMIGAGIMLISTHFYELTKLPITFPYLFIYGGILDILWRQLNLMPSLEHTYYAALNPIESFIWGGIPMIMILL
jgi:hypothetical protein